MNKLWMLLLTAALCGMMLHAQNAPAPVPAQGVATFTVMSSSATTGGTTTVIMVGSNGAAPVVVAGPRPGPMPVITASAAALPAAPGAVPVAGPSVPPVPATTMAAVPAAAPGVPKPVTLPAPAVPAMGTPPAVNLPAAMVPRVPVGLPTAVSNALASNLAALAGFGAPAPTNADNTVQLNFRDAPLDQLLNMYGDLTGRTVIKGPLLNAIITVRSQNPLTVPEAIQALESVLALNGIAVVPVGTKFAKVTKVELGRMESLALKRGDKDKPPAESDQLVSFIFTLKYLELDETLAALQNMLHLYGKIQPLERANSVMISDTAANIQRVQELLEFMDVPPEARLETRVYELENGDALTVAAQLQSIVDEAQGKTTRPRTGTTPMPIPVVIPQTAASVRPPSVNADAMEDGLIQGKVKILADERTNMLIIIARPTNYPFFERIIKELDRKVEPEVIVRVFQLHWAEADQISALLNDMLGSSGGAYGSRGTTTGGTAGSAFGATPTAGAGTRTTGSSTSRRTSSLRSSSTSRGRTTAPTAARPAGTTGAAPFNPFGNNAPNVTISTRVLADLRSNSILIMGTKEDIADLEKVIEKLDIMLSQVLIEAVILEVDLNKTTEAGITWLQRSLQAYNKKTAGPGGGAVIKDPIMAFGGGFNPNSTATTIPNAAGIVNGFALPGGSSGLPGGLSYYTTISGLNLDTILHLVNSTSDARILSTPVIMATDNEVAEIKNTKQKPVITSTTIYASTSGGTSSSYEYKDIGIDLIVKPHINPNRMVVLDITQTADSEAGSVMIDNNEVPIINKREIQGLITVEDRTTIVLGGLVETASIKGRDSIPLLGRIPLIGWLFRSDSDRNVRTELLVLITPYVLKTPEEARAESKRLHQNTEMKDVHVRGWSDSPLAKPDPEIERALRKRTLFGPSLKSPTNAVSDNAAAAAK
jgi:general secretion pathway protein D